MASDCAAGQRENPVYSCCYRGSSDGPAALAMAGVHFDAEMSMALLLFNNHECMHMPITVFELSGLREI